MTATMMSIGKMMCKNLFTMIKNVDEAKSV